jgi:anti-sigma B factor antagonist
VQQHRIGTVVVLAVRGDIDMITVPRLAEAIDDGAALDGTTALIVDLSEVDFLGSAAMTALIHSHRKVAAAKRFLVVADGPATSRPLKVMGLDTELVLYPTLDEAVATCA